MRDTGRAARRAAPRAAALSLAAALSILFSGLALLGLSSCATAGKAGGMPDWAFETPRPDGTDTYFVGHSSLKGSTAEALDDATANLVASLVQYLGVTVSVATSAEARATLDSYRADIVQTVKTEAKGRLAGFQVRSRYVDVDRKSGRTTVYLLASYRTADLEKEKARIAALFKERDDAVAKPEAEAKSLALQGRGLDAVMAYIQAAVAASGSGIDNADVKLSRNLAAARALAGRMRFIKDAGVASVNAGEAFPKPLVARLVVDDGLGGQSGVAGARLLVSYPRRQASRLSQKTEGAATDERGLLSFTPPPPDFVGAARLQVRLDIQGAIDLLEGLPASTATEVAAIENALRGIVVEIPFEVLSRARAVPMALLVADLDEAGAVLPGARTQAALADALARSGFGLKAAGIGLEGALPLDDAGLLAAARGAAQASGYLRLAYGKAQVSSVRKDGSNWIVEGRAQVKVVDLATGTILYAGDRTASVVGSDEASARGALYRELGANALAQDLLATLP